MEINLQYLLPHIEKYVDEFYVEEVQSADYVKKNLKSVSHPKMYQLLLRPYIDKKNLERQFRLISNILNVSNKGNTNSNSFVSNHFNHDTDNQIRSLKCIKEKIDIKKDYLGKGKYGYVYKINPNVAVKVTDLIGVYEATHKPFCKNHVKECIHEEYTLSKKAGELGVGPKIFNAFVCKVSKKEHYHIMYMELIKGVTLEDWLKKKNITQKDKNLVLDKLKAALTKLHQHNIIHEDLHDNNVMVTGNSSKNYDVKLVDFGLANSFQSRIQEGINWNVDNLNKILVNDPYYDTTTYLESFVITKLVKNNLLRITF